MPYSKTWRQASGKPPPGAPKWSTLFQTAHRHTMDNLTNLPAELVRHVVGFWMQQTPAPFVLREKVGLRFFGSKWRKLRGAVRRLRHQFLETEFVLEQPYITNGQVVIDLAVLRVTCVGQCNGRQFGMTETKEISLVRTLSRFGNIKSICVVLLLSLGDALVTD